MRLLYALPIVLLPNTLHLPANVAVAASILLLLGAAVFGRRDPSTLRSTGYLTAPLIGLLIAVLLGYVIAQWNDVPNAGGDLTRAKFAITYPLLYLAYLRSGLDFKATKQLIVLVLVVAVVAGLEAVSQGLQFKLSQFVEEQRATGPFGAINMANRAGVFFALFLPMFVAVAVQPGHRMLARWLAMVGGAILTAGIVLTFSRQAYVIALLGILILLAHRALTNRGIPLAALAVMALMIVGAGLLPDSVIQRMEETRQLGAGGIVSYDASTASRFEIWKGALAMVADNPGGVGLGRFGDAIGDYSSHSGRDAHNSFVLMAAECGLLALAMMLWLVWRLWNLARALRRTPASHLPEARALALGFTGAVIAMVLGNMYGSPYMEGLVMYNFWILCALMERHGALLTTIDAGPAPVPVATRFPLAARALPGFGTTKPPLTLR